MRCMIMKNAEQDVIELAQVIAKANRSTDIQPYVAAAATIVAAERMSPLLVRLVVATEKLAFPARD